MRQNQWKEKESKSRLYWLDFVNGVINIITKNKWQGREKVARRMTQFNFKKSQIKNSSRDRGKNH